MRLHEHNSAVITYIFILRSFCSKYLFLNENIVSIFLTFHILIKVVEQSQITVIISIAHKFISHSDDKCKCMIIS